MSNLWRHLAQRSMASTFLDVAKMSAFVPCEVHDELTGYRARVVKIVFDPLCMEEVNKQFKAFGYYVGDRMNVIAVNEDSSILLLGTSVVFHVRKDETIKGDLDDAHVAFYDIRRLTKRFNIRNKKTEIDELVAKLKVKYEQTT